MEISESREFQECLRQLEMAFRVHNLQKACRAQRGLDSSLKVRSIDSWFSWIRKGLYYVYEEAGEMIATFYLQDCGDNVFRVGGMCSLKKGHFNRSVLKKQLEIHKTKTLVLQTYPRLARSFVVPLGFEELSVSEFERKYPEIFKAYRATESESETALAEKEIEKYYLKFPTS